MTDAKISTMTLAAANYLSRLPELRSADDPGTEPIYLLRTGRTVLPTVRGQGFWDCNDLRSKNPTTVRATDLEIVCAPTAQAGGHGDDPEIFSRSWMAHLHDRWQGGTMQSLGQALTAIMDQETFTVQITPEVMNQLVQQTHCLPSGIRNMLVRLSDTGMLIPTIGSGEEPLSYALMVGPDVKPRA